MNTSLTDYPAFKKNAVEIATKITKIVEECENSTPEAMLAAYDRIHQVLMGFGLGVEKPPATTFAARLLHALQSQSLVVVDKQDLEYLKLIASPSPDGGETQIDQIHTSFTILVRTPENFEVRINFQNPRKGNRPPLIYWSIKDPWPVHHTQRVLEFVQLLQRKIK